MKAVSVNISGGNLAVSKEFVTFVMRTCCKLSEYSQDISHTADNKAAIPEDDSISVVSARSQNFKGVVASLLHINQILSTMRTCKNLTANAQGASKSRVCGAKSVSPLHTFRVKLSSYYCFPEGRKCTYTLDKEVEAVSRAEAIGMVVVELSAITPSWDIQPIAFGGMRICTQLS